jgi:GTP-binding protein HflX
VRTADALLVVADAASPELDAHLKVVGTTLREIGCGDHPRLLVLNQVDRLTRPRRIDLRKKHPQAAFTTALEKEGIEEVREWLRELIPGPPKPREPEWWELEAGLVPAPPLEAAPGPSAL